VGGWSARPWWSRSGSPLTVAGRCSATRVGDSETEVFWTESLRCLRERGLQVGPGGVQLVISDHHRGLMNAINAVLGGASWQRCRVHFMRNVAAKGGKTNAQMVAAAIRTIFAQPTAEAVRAQLGSVANTLAGQFPAVAEMLTDSAEQLTAFADFPPAHWRQIWSNNPIERLNKEIKRRTNVVGIFPNAAALTRLTGAVLIEIHDEWAAAERRYLSEASMATLAPAPASALPPAPTPQPTADADAPGVGGRTEELAGV
jgi:putative transposase